MLAQAMSTVKCDTLPSLDKGPTLLLGAPEPVLDRYSTGKTFQDHGNNSFNIISHEVCPFGTKCTKDGLLLSFYKSIGHYDGPREWLLWATKISQQVRVFAQ